MRIQHGRGRPASAGLPARLVLLLALALALGTISIAKLRAGTTLVTTLRAQERDLGSGTRFPAGVQAQDDTGDDQPLQAGEGGAEGPGACFDKFPWIQPALDTFFEPAWAAANASTQSTEQALEALRGVMWGKYHPGMDEVVLEYNPQSGQVEMSVLQVSPPNQPHKKRCMLGVLRDAVAVHGAALAPLLAGRQLRLMVETEDFGVTWRNSKWKLPAFAMCTDSAHTDIPVPDFTFGCYPEARYKNSSWPAVQELLQRKSDMVGWQERHPELFHRSNWAVGPRRGLMPLLQSYANGSAGVSARDAFGADLDISDTGFVHVKEGQAQGKHDEFVWLDGQCDYKYLIHTAGFSYSGGLKYKLACGSLVFKFGSDFKEFFEPALQDDVHVVKLPANKEGVDVERFKQHTVPRIREVVQRTLGLPDQPPIARAGQAFVREQLTPEALSCYWLGALQRYAEIYFLPQTPAQAAAVAGGGSGGDGNGAAGATAGEAAGETSGTAGGAGASGSAAEGTQSQSSEAATAGQGSAAATATAT